MGGASLNFSRFVSMKNKSLKLKIVAITVSVIVVALLAWFLLSDENILLFKSIFSGNYTQDEIQDKLREVGIRGYITISVLSMLQVIVAILPAEPVQVLAGITFGFIRGLAACAVGVFIGNTVIYLLYKLFGTKLNTYFDKNLDIDIGKAGESGKITALIFILYFLPAIPYGMICFFASTMRLKYPKYIVITTLCSVPSICIGVALGHMAMSASWIISVGVLALIVTLLIVVMNNRDILIKKANEYLAKSKEPHTSKTIVKSYSKRILDVLYVGSRIVFFFKGVKLVYRKKVEVTDTPCIVLVNHGAFSDFAYAGTLLREKSPNFIVNRMYFYHKTLKQILKGVGCFPKSMFTADLESMKNCMRVIKSGGVLAMMPEARLSTAGRFEDIQEGTYAFLKKMNVPVYSIKISGDYLSKPKWAKKMRRGSLVEAELDLLFTKDDLANLSEEQIGSAVISRLSYDEFKWLEERPDVKYKSRKIAEGLENILSICPKCKQLYTIKTNKRKVYCTSCGYANEVGSRYEFKNSTPYSNFAHWYDWQFNFLREKIASDPDFALTESVVLKSPSIDGKTMLRESGAGECKLDRSGLYYTGTKDGKNIEKFFPISSIYRILFGAGENFEIYDDKEIYFFVPNDGRCCVNWYIVSKILKENPSI